MCVGKQGERGDRTTGVFFLVPRLSGWNSRVSESSCQCEVFFSSSSVCLPNFAKAKVLPWSVLNLFDSFDALHISVWGRPHRRCGASARGPTTEKGREGASRSGAHPSEWARRGGGAGYKYTARNLTAYLGTGETLPEPRALPAG